MKFDQKELYKVIGRLRRICKENERGGYAPILGCVRIRGDAKIKGFAEVEARSIRDLDGRCTLSATISCEDATDICVSGGDLWNAIKGERSGETEIVAKDGFAMVHVGATTSQLVCYDVTEWGAPHLKKVPKHVMAYEGKGMYNLISWLTKAVYMNMDRQNISNVFFDKTRAVSCDTHRMHMVELPCGGPDLLIPGGAAKWIEELAKDGNKMTVYYEEHKEERKSFRVCSGIWKFEAEQGKEEMPDYTRALTGVRSNEIEITLDSKLLKKALASIIRGAGRDLRNNPGIKLSIGEQLGIEWEVKHGSRNAKATMGFLCNTQKEGTREIGVNIHYLIDVLPDDVEQVVIRIAEKEDALLIDVDGKAGRSALVMPSLI